MSQKVETVFRYNGAEYEFDARDLDDAERFEKALQIMEEQEKNMPKDGTASSLIRYQCQMLKEFFDNCLGEGAGDAVCTKKNNISVCYEAYIAFLDMLKAQKEDIVRLNNSRRASNGNRQSRRHEQGNGQPRYQSKPQPDPMVRGVIISTAKNERKHPTGHPA